MTSEREAYVYVQLPGTMEAVPARCEIPVPMHGDDVTNNDDHPRNYNLVSQAGRFGLSVEDAHAEIARIINVVRHWRDSFFACGVSTKVLIP